MLTDAPPRKTNRAGFLESDRIKALDLPSDGHLQEIAVRLAKDESGWLIGKRDPCTYAIAATHPLVAPPSSRSSDPVRE